MSSVEFRELARAAARRFGPGGRFAVGFAQGKLTRDPIFEHLLAHGLFNPPVQDPGSPANPRVMLDLGCGQGVVAALLAQADEAIRAGRWPARWPQPVRTRFHGIELMPRDVARARAALGDAATFVTGDIARSTFPAAHTVLILDVLHYLPYEAQDRVLADVRRALEPDGRLLMRIGDADGGFGFRWSNWVDHVVTWIRGHRLPRLYCRSLSQWSDLLRQHGFDIEQRPMSEGTLFANVLLIANLRARPASVPATSGEHS